MVCCSSSSCYYYFTITEKAVTAINEIVKAGNGEKLIIIYSGNVKRKELLKTINSSDMILKKQRTMGTAENGCGNLIIDGTLPHQTYVVFGELISIYGESKEWLEHLFLAVVIM